MPDLAGVRRQRILDLVRTEGSVRVSDLSRRFQVTPETIRREINRLAGEGRLVRVHGGAVLPTAVPEEPFPRRLARQLAEKGAIAAAAAGLVEEGDTIVLDASTTALALGRALAERQTANLVVLTNGAELPLHLGPSAGITVLCLGGSMRWRSRSYVGPLTVGALSQYRVRKAFISCQGFTLDSGPSESNDDDAQVKSAMVRAAAEVILLVDHTKWGRNALVPICPLAGVRRLVTDRQPPAADHDQIAGLGIDLRVAQPRHPARVGGLAK